MRLAVVIALLLPGVAMATHAQTVPAGSDAGAPAGPAAAGASHIDYKAIGRVIYSCVALEATLPGLSRLREHADPSVSARAAHYLDRAERLMERYRVMMGAQWQVAPDELSAAADEAVSLRAGIGELVRGAGVAN
jgi:hypothetical protein